MKIVQRYLLLVVLCIFQSLQLTHAQQSGDLKLWYEKPATQWLEALPVGNGRLGAMVYGDPSKECIQLNENTVWAGRPYRNDKAEAKEALGDVRKMIFDGKYKEALDLVNQKMIGGPHGMSYQTAGNLRLNFAGHEHFTNYYRELDLEKATVSSRYTVDAVNYTTKVFSSFPDQVIIARISADKSGSINFSASMDRPGKVKVSSTATNELVLSGVSSDQEGIKGGVQFEAKVKIITNGGSVTSTDSTLTVSNANTATIYISIATNFNNYKDISGDENKRATEYLNKAFSKSYDKLLTSHITGYQKYFNRVKLDLGTTPAADLPTDERLKNFRNTNDPNLVSLYFQYGR
jgi:alpha-L-fucosidase 2